MPASRLHLVDGTFELFRAHFSPRPGHEHLGRDLKATVGVAASLIALLQDPDEAVTHLAVAFDNPIRSVRNEWFDGYKSDAGVPPELRSQFDLAEQAVRALGITVWSMDRYEADDALATGATRYGGDVEQVRIMTPDKDLGQVLDGVRVVLVDRIRSQVIDEAELMRRRGLAPKSVPDWLALVGDDADGIPGLAGFGDKTAAALLRVFGQLEQIPDDAAKWPTDIRGAKRLAETLKQGRTAALLYRKLATLIRDVPLKERFEDLEWRGAPRQVFREWCGQVGAEKLYDRPSRWLAG